jgi:hypothetical protein
MSKPRGIAPIIIVVVLAVLAVGGFFLYRSGSLPIPGIAMRATEKDFANITDPTLRKHFVAQANVNSFRTVGESSGKGTKDTTEFQLKGDNFSYRMKSEEGGKEASHFISIGDTSYVKDYSDNTWWKQTVKPEETTSEEAPPTPEDLKEEFMKEDPALYKSLGTEACGSLNCFKYEQTFKDTPGTRTFWFDDKKYLLRKEISGYGEFSNTIEYSYDGISISAPSPTKDVPEGKNIYEYMFAAPASSAPSGGTYTVPTLNPSDYSIPTEDTTPPEEIPADTGY